MRNISYKNFESDVSQVACPWRATSIVRIAGRLSVESDEVWTTDGRKNFRISMSGLVSKRNIADKKFTR